jgi:mono/diheme cytochrome c family protein
MARRLGLALALVGAVLLLAALALPVQARGVGAPPLPAATPTVDRLAAPPTVEHPSQADLGAQLFWGHCQPCHGDQGQGLTDDWRAQYPVEDQNCWKSRCHGASPYANGFTLPTVVPAVIGPATLARFNSAADLHRFISQAMPFQAPGSLTDEEYWALTAFLLRAHDVATPVAPFDSEEQALLIGLHGTLAPPTPTQLGQAETPLPSSTPAPPIWARPGGEWLGLGGVIAALGVAAGLLAVSRRSAPKPDHHDPHAT